VPTHPFTHSPIHITYSPTPGIVAAMLRVDFVTLFPDMVMGAVGHSILKRAETAGKVAYRTSDPRDFSTDKHRTVDAKPYGDSAGMLLMAEPVACAIDALEPAEGAAIVMTDPTGTLFDQEAAATLARHQQVIFVCGHYEGIDDRIRQTYATHVYSIGDFVLTNGELPSLVMADAIVRLLDGVLGSARSLEQDSHADGLLSAPQFARPETWRDCAVPEVLRSGDHRRLELWRRAQALQITRDRRPDLFARAELMKGDLELLSEDFV
jgi:tRNA (guanine37-N1)-methyltransferase